ncbi:hypothetical protein J7I94_33850 [Streptomyces sp. ISL-12]|nr:hypothetical protein [Streptomyces sp. ISL-12]
MPVDFFLGFSPAVSDEAAKQIRVQIRRWRLHVRSETTLEELAREINPVVRGRINCFGRFHPSALRSSLRDQAEASQSARGPEPSRQTVSRSLTDHFRMSLVWALGSWADGRQVLRVSDDLVPDDLWDRVAPLLPPRPPRRRRYPGRLPADDRAALGGIVYVGSLD